MPARRPRQSKASRPVEMAAIYQVYQILCITSVRIILLLRTFVCLLMILAKTAVGSKLSGEGTEAGIDQKSQEGKQLVCCVYLTARQVFLCTVVKANILQSPRWWGVRSNWICTEAQNAVWQVRQAAGRRHSRNVKASPEP